MNRRSPGSEARATSTTAIASTESTAYLGQLRRRRAAVQRTPPLDCGCPDPWPCRCTEPPLSERALDGWRDAAQHVVAGGHMPIVPLEVRRALYRRGAGDRALAELLHRGCGEVAS